ncbi:unnamed protein product [Mytilus edulis]|uniref:Uncharacterized protein n=1 Tax=Mytilus edulis TaxID=6550 RepID=A0A8S3Q639_MYTED|nr:unnamed protein product [Mytilus edulis]
MDSVTGNDVRADSNVNNMAALFTSTMVNTFTQCMASMQPSVSHIRPSPDSFNKTYDLANWYEQRNASDVPLIPVSGTTQRTAAQHNFSFSPSTSALPFSHHTSAEMDSTRNGVRSDSFTNVDIVSPNIQRNIIEGKDINLTTLLISNYENPQAHNITADEIKVNLSSKPDPRLNRNLNIQDFIQAFGKYKRIMCVSYPERREELDAYEADLIQIHKFYGDKFYTYHKLFSAKAATLLREKHIKVDWSKKARDILSLVSGGIRVNACNLCHQVDHATEFCALQISDHQGIHVDSNLGNNRSVRPNMQNKLDKQGRSRVFYDGKEVCDNYNNVRGCFRTTCNLLHACSTCRSTGHPAHTCTGNRQNHHVPQKYSQTYKNNTSSKDVTQTKPDNKS